MNTPITLETDEISCAQQDEFAVLSRAFVTNWSALFRTGKVDQG